MSVSLLEVLENAGFDVKNNIRDAEWLMSKEDEFDELVEIAEGLQDDYEDYEDFCYLQEELGEEVQTFEEWRKENR